ncbi:MAG TPA: hypothetical protein VNL14_18900 [Candidatus Acidoferrales bacterium]|nr:hypothetical protein [Candidatus Acidoferrales bacterium]
MTKAMAPKSPTAPAPSTDRERLDENRHLAQRARDDVHVLFVVDDRLGHEAVRLLDAALGKISREAKILALGAARDAMLVRAGPPHHRNDEIAGLDARDRRAGLDRFAQGFVPDHEMIAVRRRRPVLKR